MLSVSPSLIAQTYNQIGVITSQEVSARKDNSQDPVPPVQPVTESVFVSDEAQALSRQVDNSKENGNQQNSDGSDRQAPEEFSSADQVTVQKLQSRDREVRAHEQAHLAAAGQYARGGASFAYQRGPDGQLYAVGGEVAIDVGRESTPLETIAKMQAVRRAALAPANPSAADRQIAAQASMRMAEAQRELSTERSQVMQGSKEDSSTPTSNEQTTISAGSIANRRILMAEAYKAVNELF